MADNEATNPVYAEEAVHFKIADTPPAEEVEGDEEYALEWYIDGYANIDDPLKIFG